MKVVQSKYLIKNKSYFNKPKADPGQQDPVLWQQYINTHGLPGPVGEVGGLTTLSRGECPNRLLLLFWAHYIDNDPHLLCTGSWL